MDEAPQRGPKRELTHETIVDAAIMLADQGGLVGVTMQRVAEALGFSAMALYRYVASKDELIMLMQDRAMNLDGAWPVEADDWRTGLTDVATTLRANYQRHPWMLDVALSATTAAMPNSVRYTDAAFRAMRRLPVPVGERGVVVLAVSLIVRSYCALERDLAAAVGADGPASGEFTPGIVALLREVVTPERFPDLAPVAAAFYTGDGDDVDDFQFVFGRFLDGLEAHARSRPLPPPAPPASPTPAELLPRPSTSWPRSSLNARKPSAGSRTSSAASVKPSANATGPSNASSSAPDVSTRSGGFVAEPEQPSTRLAGPNSRSHTVEVGAPDLGSARPTGGGRSPGRAARRHSSSAGTSRKCSSTPTPRSRATDRSASRSGPTARSRAPRSDRDAGSPGRAPTADVPASPASARPTESSRAPRAIRPS